MTADLSWRLRVASGSGFAATPTRAVTCAHVVDRGPTCEVAPLGGGVTRRRAAQPITAWPADRRADVAVVDIAGHTGSLAPIGPRARPAIGAVVEILGLPPREDRGVGLADGDLLGRRVRARIAGSDASGTWLQVNPVDRLQSWVDGGFSGSAAVDETTGRVVGMVVAADKQTTAWLIPLDTIIGWLPWLGDRAGDPLWTDPGFVRFRELLQAGRYAEAMEVLRTVEPRFRVCSDTYFYWALTMLGGIRPAHHSAPTVAAVTKVLGEACRLDPRSPHPRALLALIHEDFYAHSAIGGPRPDMTGLTEISADRATEIVQHVPAPECRAWQSLLRTADRPGMRIR
jgi:hypothetical protein